MAWSPDSRRLAFMGDNGSVKIWEGGTAAAIWTLVAGGTDAGKHLAWSPDGRWLAGSAFTFGPVLVWNSTTGKLAKQLHGHADYVRSVAWSPDSRRLVSASQDGTVKVWDLLSGQELLTFRGDGELSRSWMGATFSPDGWRLAASQGSVIHVWDATPQQK